MKKFSVLVVLIAACAGLAFAQGSATIQPPTAIAQNSGTTQLLITVSPVTDQIVWAAGTGGTFVVTTDGGNHWTSGVVAGAENDQFRDVWGVSDKVAYLMSIGNNTTDFRVWKTRDGGNSWSTEYANGVTNAFYDCFGFWTPDRGFTQSDSVNGVFPDIATTDGNTWHLISGNLPPALPGEASFAASGTCVAVQGEGNGWVTTGGTTIARILATKDAGNTWAAYDTPLIANPSAGGISVAFRDALHGIVGGGDLSTNTSSDAAVSSDGGQTWTLTNTPPVQGAIFCVAYVKGLRNNASSNPDDPFERAVMITTETEPDYSSGEAAFTPDEGTTWITIPNASGYWAVAFANPHAGWFVGNNGSILKVSF